VTIIYSLARKLPVNPNRGGKYVEKESKSRSEIGSQQKLTGPSGHEENGTVNGEPEKGGHSGTALCNIKPLEETLEGDIKSGKIPAI